MRIPRQRVFRIVINGKNEWREDAAGRNLLEVQHKLATEVFKGCSVRVQEQYLGGAKSKLEVEDEE